jgi:hypothetical protein
LLREGRAGATRALCILAALVAGWWTPAVHAAVGPVASPGQVRAWSVEYMSGIQTVTLDEALATANAFGAVVATPRVYRPYVSQMKAANPNLVLFVYMKGIFTYDTSLPEDAYSHDANGARIAGLQFPGTWLMNPRSPDAVAYVSRRAIDLVRASGYDGVFLDTLGPAALNPSFVQSLPIDPLTGVVWTVGDWVTATAALAGQVAAALGKPTIANGLRDGPNYFNVVAPTRVLLLTGLNGAMAEGWLRGAMNPITRYPKESDWKLNVDALADAGSLGASFLAVTKVWIDGTQAQKDAWYTFAVASYLLGNDGHAYISFSYAQGDETVVYQLCNLDLGTPLGPYFKNTVYRRRFSNGLVLVNPTTSTYTFTPARTYYQLDGTPVTTVKLTPDTAVILRTTPT